MAKHREGYLDVHADRPLTNFSIAHFQSMDKFISGKIFPVMSVQRASDTYDVYPQGYWNRLHDTRREEESVANTINYGVRSDSYACKEHALRIFVSDKKRANADVQRDLDFESTKIVMQSLVMRREIDWANAFLKSGIWGIDYDGDVVANTTKVTKWSDAASNPIEQIKDACLKITLNSAGLRPNKLIISPDVWRQLTEHPELKKRVGYTGGGGAGNMAIMVTKQAVAALFEIEEIIVMESIVNKAVPGLEDADGEPPVDNAFIAEKCALLAYVPSSVGRMSPCPGITFAWDNYITHSAGVGPAMRRYRPADGRKGEYIEAEFAIDQKMCSADCAAFFDNLI